MIACRAAEFALVRPDHQLISINDIIPTPSHPTSSCIMLPDEVSIIIDSKKISSSFWNFFVGSFVIYHDENCIIDHVIRRAIGRNRIKYLFNEIVMFIVPMSMMVRDTFVVWA